jgi:hypothetical protein
MKLNYFFASIIWIFIFIGISSGEIFRLENGTILQGTITYEDEDNISIFNNSYALSYIKSPDIWGITLKRSEISNIIKEAVFDKEIDLEQLSKLNDDDWNKLEYKSKLLGVKPDKTKSLAEKYHPRIGLLAGYLVPAGQIASVLKPGLTYGFLFDIHMPVEFMERHGIDWRMGLSGNYTKLSSTGKAASAEMTLMPVLISNEFGFQTKYDLRPYFKLDCGVSMSRLKYKSDNPGGKNLSSTDMDVLAGLGAGYRNRNLPMLEFFLEAAYMRIFEQTSGDFYFLSFGISYHFFSKGE